MFLAVFALLSLSSFAAPPFASDVACDSSFVRFTSPFAGQEQVPVDVVVAAGVAQGCQTAPEYTLSLLQADTVVHTTTIESRYVPLDLFELTPSTPLKPNTEYLFQIIPQQGWGETTVIQFITGERTVLDLDGAPSGRVETAEVEQDRSASYSTLTLVAAGDSDALSIVRLKSPDSGDTPIAFYRVPEDSMPFEVPVTQWHELPAPEELCYTIEQRNGLGIWTDASIPFCKIPDVLKANGQCTTLSISSLSWYLPLLTLAAISRRRSVA